MLRKLFFITSLFSILLVSKSFSYIQTLENTTIFHGDSHGEFQNNVVALLSDGSAWKVHPEDQVAFSQWAMSDKVHISVRTSFYFFSRQHKFELVNHSRPGTVRVMLVGYPQQSLNVVDAVTEISGRQLVPYTTNIGGHVMTFHKWVNTYDKKIYLNDGSVWILRDKNDFKKFQIGHQIYMGRNTGEGASYFLISGTQREAQWGFVARGKKEGE